MLGNYFSAADLLSSAIQPDRTAGTINTTLREKAMKIRMLSVVCVSLVSLSCSDKNSGKSIGAPAIKPPVDNNMPAGLKGTSLRLADSGQSSVAVQIRDYLYPTNGFVGPIDRLKMVDDRMAELEIRAKDSEKPCLNDEAKLFDIGGLLPNGDAFDQKFQCREDLSSPDASTSLAMGFGIADNKLYLEENTKMTDGSGIVVLVQASQDGSKSDVWDIRYSSETGQNNDNGDATATFMHIVGSNADGVEFATAGSSSKTGSFWCGVHVKSDKAYVYVEGIVPNGQQAAGSSCASTEKATLCFTAEDMAGTDIDKCTDAKLDQFALASLDSDAAESALADAKKIVLKTIEGPASFSK